MSRAGSGAGAANARVQGAQARVFAALGDETRLRLVARLSGGEACSIAELTGGSGSQTADSQTTGRRLAGRIMTRQAVTKHLRVLERVGLVRCSRAGRERLFAFDPGPVEEMREYLGFVSAKWDEALGRLKTFVEE